MRRKEYKPTRSAARWLPNTEIYCGIDYIAMNKMKWIKEKNIQLAYTLRKVTNQIDRANADALSRVRFRLNKEEGRIISERIP